MKDLRKYKEYELDHPDFNQVKKEDDWNIAILYSPPSTKTKETYNGRSAWFFNVSDEVAERLLRIKWQDKHNMYVVGGTKIPTMDKEEMIEVYERFKSLQETE